jgi:hypothetical protein
VLEWQAEQDRHCKGCGQNLDETFGPDNFDKWNAELAGSCDACRARSRAAHIAAGKDDLDPMAGLMFRTWRDQASTNGEMN